MNNVLFKKGDKPIGLCNDHAGYELKEHLKTVLEANNIEYKDFGTCSSESVDYPDYAHKMGTAIDNGDIIYGIAICGTGNGINMTMNKHQSVRAALCWNLHITEMARRHNNANVLTLPGREVSKEEGVAMFEKFFSTEFEGGRHQNRINKIACK